MPPAMAKEVRMAARSNATMEDLDQLGKRVPLTCPECGGTLWELDNGGARFRCHTGHGYTINSLAAEQSVQVEAALWAGLRRLEDSERLYPHMDHGARTRGNERSALYHAEMARSSAGHADTLRELLREKSSAPGASETE